VIVLAWVSFALAAVPALLYLFNSRVFRPPPAADDADPPCVSVLIPARDEEASIGRCVESVLASVGVRIEVIVLDDHSRDGTAEAVARIARKDARVRLESAPPLPHGWCGKQHACSALARLARHPVLTFLDADVRLAPDALARMVRFLEDSGAGLVSGFPRQETGTFLEKLLIPLVNWLLLGYLPMGWMRRTRWPAFGAGCGQWFMTRRSDYDRVGGHAAVRTSLHDGLTLPRAYRRAGLKTDVCDASGLAICRMYRSASSVWSGFSKNAREGLADRRSIAIWTVLLAGGHVLPLFILSGALAAGQGVGVAGAAAALSCLPRLHAAWRFGDSWLGAVFHPFGVFALLAIQWSAAFRKTAAWKGRTYPT
jgi:hypothetical protein